MIRLSKPFIEKKDIDSVIEVLESGYLVQGKVVESFEKCIAQYTGAKYAVAVSNCTAALHLSLLALNVRPGDIVIVPAYSWLSTANVVELCGAQPVFIDIQRDTFNMDPEHLTDELNRLVKVDTIAKRVAAIIPVHTFGQMSDMHRIIEIAQKYSIPVIEDAACALGASLNGKQAGTFGLLGCYSFHPRKTITTGEGGIIVTNSSDLMLKLRALRNHGLDPQSSSPDFIMPGFNYRMTDFQAALGLTQMNKLEKIIEQRLIMANTYNRKLKNSHFHLPYSLHAKSHIYQSYVILLPDHLANKRQYFIDKLKSDEFIEATIGTWNMPMTSFFRNRYGYQNDAFPVANMVFQRSISLPLYFELNEGQLLKITNALLAI